MENKEELIKKLKELSESEPATNQSVPSPDYPEAIEIEQPAMCYSPAPYLQQEQSYPEPTSSQKFTCSKCQRTFVYYERENPDGIISQMKELGIDFLFETVCAGSCHEGDDFIIIPESRRPQFNIKIKIDKNEDYITKENVSVQELHDLLSLWIEKNGIKDSGLEYFLPHPVPFNSDNSNQSIE